MPQPRDVLRLWDRHTHPNKVKRHICVCPQKQFFLRINTEPIFRPNHLIYASANPFLDHDSYVELQQMVRHIAYEIGRAEHLGRMSLVQARGLIRAVHEAETLSQDDKEFIETRLLKE
jgi:hypothetical protein